MLYPSTLSNDLPRTTLRDAVEFLDSRRKPITQKDRKPGPFPYYGANGQQDSVADYLFDEPLILLAEDGGHFGDPQKTIAYQVEGKCWVNNHAHVLKPKANFDIGYLRRHLESYDVTSFITGSTRGKLTKTAASRIPILAPPLDEQRRIAAILDKADAVRRKRKEAIALTEDLLRSAFLEMFGDPVTNPKGWESGTILDIVSDKKKGVRCGPFGTQLKVHEIVSEGIPLYGIESVKGGRFRSKAEKYITIQKAEELKSFDVQSGDVLVTRMGTIGHACVVSNTVGESRFSYHLFRVRPDSLKCLPGFLSATITRSGTFLSQLERLSHGAIMSGLKTADLKEVRFLLPPMALQKHYLKIVSKTEEALERQIEKMSVEENLFNSLLQRAFRGDL